MTAFLDEWFDLQPGQGQFQRIGPGHALPQGITHRAAGPAAIALCLTTPVAVSMTPRQMEIFQTLCHLQMEDTGPHALLPHVIDALLELARRPPCRSGFSREPAPPNPLSYPPHQGIRGHPCKNTKPAAAPGRHCH